MNRTNLVFTRIDDLPVERVHLPSKKLLINMRAAAIVIICLLMVGCATQRNAEKYYGKHPEKMAEACSEKFPVKDSFVVVDSVHFDTLYMEGEPVILKDSFYIKGDTIVKQVTKECPKVSTIVKTVMHDSIVYKRDMAREAVLEAKITALTKQIAVTQSDKEKAEEGRSKWRLWCLITWAVCAGYIGIKLFKPQLPFKI